MKILLGIQATGNGHITRCIELYEMLQSNPHITVIDVLVSGDNATIPLPFPVRYRYKGFSFSYGKSGKINLLKSIPHLSFYSFAKGVMNVPFDDYDLVVSDFEPITCWGAKLKGIKTIGFGNMFTITSKEFPNKSMSCRLHKLLTRVLCPVKEKYAMHFSKFDNFIYYPIIRKEIRLAKPQVQNFTLIYLLSFSEEELVSFFGHESLREHRFIIYAKTDLPERTFGNVTVKPTGLTSFTHDLIHCKGVITTGGFQTTAEAVHLGKKLLCIPIKKQFEQQCNCKILNEIGVSIMHELKHSSIKNWLEHARPVHIDFGNDLTNIVALMTREELRKAA